MRSSGLRRAAGLCVGGKGRAVEGRFTALVVDTRDSGWGDGSRVFTNISGYHSCHITADPTVQVGGSAQHSQDFSTWYGSIP